ncbi:MAG: HypC/HybG/HupF family hydrogenase formation chaperone [Planctomycetota bacterium]
MCLAIPAKILEIDGVMSKVDINGVKREANLSLLPDTGVGDYVLIHAGFAIQKWEEEDVQEFNEIVDSFDPEVKNELLDSYTNKDKS